jgi:hypothetical protein
MQMAMSERMFRGNRESKTVDVVAGEVAQVALDAGEKPIDGPTAHLFGSVMVDGRFGEGYHVQGHGNNRQLMATTDRAGRFDLGAVPVGKLWLSVVVSDGMMSFDNSTIWTGEVELKEGEERELVVTVETSAIAGQVVDATGAPVAGAIIIAHCESEEDRGSNWRTLPSDAAGRFEFTRLPIGKWTIEVRGAQGRTSRAGVDGIELAAGVPVTGLRLAMAPVAAVKGRVDLAMFGSEKPRWGWISVCELAPDGQGLAREVAGIRFDLDDGTFANDEMLPGSYGVRLRVWGTNMRSFRCQDLVVPPQGLEGVLLRGQPE